MKRVSVDIVTGFLGAGKTTLLSHVLGGALAGRRVAVVMNEIGDVGIDGEIVTGLEHVEKMVELASGCICCSIDDYSFDLAIAELVSTADPSVIVIETTGLAYPEPTIERVRRAGLGLDAVITVVDAANFTRATRESGAVKAQVKAADFIVVNKSDLCSQAEMRALAKRLQRINRRALRLVCERGQVDTDLLFGASVQRYRREAETATALAPARGALAHLEREGLEVFSYRGRAALDRVRFERFLAGLPAAVYRAKGFVRLHDNDWSCLFNFTCGRYELDWIKLSRPLAGTQAVFIGANLEPLREKILQALAACEA